MVKALKAFCLWAKVLEELIMYASGLKTKAEINGRDDFLPDAVCFIGVLQMNKLQNKVAIITGGGKGIGKAIA